VGADERARLLIYLAAPAAAPPRCQNSDDGPEALSEDDVQSPNIGIVISRCQINKFGRL